MTSVMDTQKENVKKVFYAAVGTPMVAGRKFIDFGTDLFTETSLEDLDVIRRMAIRSWLYPCRKCSVSLIHRVSPLVGLPSLIRMMLVGLRAGASSATTSFSTA